MKQFMKKYYNIISVVCIIGLISTIVIFNIKYVNAKEELSQKSTEYDNVCASYSDAQEQISTLTDAKERLSEENETIKADNDKLSTELEDTKAENVELSSTNDALEAENKEIVDSYTDAIQTRYKYTDLDYEYLLRMAETETYGADMMSKTHVISVALNRAKAYGMSPYAVITSPNQFAYGRTAISQSSIDALEYVLYNGDTAQGALFFHSGGYSATFCGRPCIFGDDVGHYFY